MRVKLRTGHIKIEDTAQWESVVMGLFKGAAETIGLSLQTLDEVWIADDDQYGAAIRQLNPNAGYTKNEHFVGVAKTIARKQDDGSVVSSIVLSDPCIFNIWNAVQTDQWGYAALLSLYLVCHELGHCEDNYRREDCEELKISDKGYFKIRQVAKYYVNILQGEFGACVYSAQAMVLEVYRSDLESAKSSAIGLLNEARSKALSYDGDPEKGQELLFMAAGAFWTILIQYAKLVASRLGNPKLAELPLSFWQGCNPKSDAILQDFTKQLAVWWNEGDDVSNNFSDDIYNIWENFALSNGYTFYDTEPGDAISWNFD